MKSLTNAFGIITIGCLLPLTAQEVPVATNTTSKPPNGPSDKTETPGKVFSADNRMAVEKFFHSSKDEPNGLPAGWSKPATDGMPLMWRSGRISVGDTITEKHRVNLMTAPADLVALLPKSTAETRYYLAGSNVIAVNPEYRVLDSIRVSTISYAPSAAADDKDAEKSAHPDKEAPLGRDGKQGLSTQEQKPAEARSTTQGDVDITEEHLGRDGEQGKKSGD